MLQENISDLVNLSVIKRFKRICYLLINLGRKNVVVQCFPQVTEERETELNRAVCRVIPSIHTCGCTVLQFRWNLHVV